MPRDRDDLPQTLKRSNSKARRTWIKAHASAVKTYGEGGRAHRAAMAAVKHSFEKVGDHWEPKAQRGPSDAHAAGKKATTAGGVDANASLSHLRQLATRLGIKGRSAMKKQELVRALQRECRRRTTKSK